MNDLRPAPSEVPPAADEVEAPPVVAAETAAEAATRIVGLGPERARLLALLDHVPFGVVFAEAPSGRVVAGNRQVERILRHAVLPGGNVAAPERWIGYHADGRAVQPEEYPLARAVRYGEASGREEYLYRRGDGTLAWVQLSASPIRDAEGEIVAAVMSIVDVDEERRIQKQQAALNAFGDRVRDAAVPAEITAIAAEALGRALGAIRAGCAWIDGEHLTVTRDWSDFSVDAIAGSYRLDSFGVEIIEALRRGRTLVVADVATDPLTAPQLERFMAAGIRTLVTVPWIDNDALQAVLFVADREPRCWNPLDLALIRDVADRTWIGIERARAEQAKRESELRFRAITESMPQMVWSTPPDGLTDYFNQRWYDFTGMPRSSTEGENWADVFHPDDQKRSRECWQYSVDTGALYEIEYRLRRHDGVYRWVLGRAVPMRDEHGAILRWFGTCTDIDDQVRARELLTRSSEVLEREVVARTTELRSAYERLTTEMAEREKTEERLRQSQKMEAVGQLTGGIAHDFNNLMTGIIGSLGQLRKRLDAAVDDDVGRYLDIALASANRAASLTHRLLAFSRRQSLDTRAIDVAALVASMVDLLRRTLGEQIVLEVDIASHPWTARADGNQLENALLNLVINARDAMPHGGRLQISVANVEIDDREAGDELAGGDYVMLAVTDSGTGMPADVVARAFDPFFTTKPIGQGTGLGLSMVYGFVRQIGGQVRIESEPGRGTVVRLHLPRETGPAVVPTAKPVEASVPAASGRRGTILVVEDDEGVRALVTEFLGELGYVVLEAADGVGGLALSADLAQPIDLLLTDVGLPGMNGRQLADAVRIQRPQLKVLFMTGYAETAIVRSGFLGPGMAMLTKPFTLDSLIADVQRIFEAPALV